MRSQKPIRQCFVLPQQPKQQVLSFNVRRPELTGLVASKENYPPRLLRIAFEHVPPSSRPLHLPNGRDAAPLNQPASASTSRRDPSECHRNSPSGIQITHLTPYSVVAASNIPNHPEVLTNVTPSLDARCAKLAPNLVQPLTKPPSSTFRCR